MSAPDNKMFPNLDYKKLKLKGPENQPRFQAIKLSRYIFVVVCLALAISALSAYIKSKRPMTVDEIHDYIRTPKSSMQSDENLESRAPRGPSIRY